MNDSSLVYSTESGAICPKCEKALDECSCNPSAKPKDGAKTVRVSKTNKGRKGKTVTLIKGLRMNPSEARSASVSIQHGCPSPVTRHQR